MSNARFKNLLEPFHIGPVKTRNRIIKPGAAMLYWREDELQMNDRVKAFYDAIARGGAGLIIVESPVIDYPAGARWRRRYRIDDDRYIRGLSELTEIIHKYGCPTFMQMNHDGPWQTKNWDPPNIPPLFTGQPIAASPVSFKAVNDFHNDLPRELTVGEIEEIVEKFARAAVRAQKAGFDGVDVNAASSHLLHNFLSPFWNRRQDAYGGSPENRARFLVGIVREIKTRLGKNFPVSITINGVEVGRLAGIESKFISSEDSVKTAGLLKEAGGDAIQVRSQWLGYHVAGFFPEALFYPEVPFPTTSFPDKYDYAHHGAGAHVTLGAAIKGAVSIPVIAVGRLDPELGEKVLREGKADFIALNRRLLADPELPNKIASGQFEAIAPCTACHTCLEPSEVKRCRINPLLGSDRPYVYQPPDKKKKVLVVGAGPAGMEASRVAALRGHEVILYDKSPALGGLLPIASVVKGLEIEDLPALVRYFKVQLDKLGVKIELGKEVDLKTINQNKPDVLVLATGGLHSSPKIPGIDRPNVINASNLHRRLKFYLKYLSPGVLRWLTKIWLPVGRKVVIIGGGKQGCELAEFLVKRGRKVVIVDSSVTLGEGLFHHLKCALFSWFEKKGVILIPGAKCLEITDKGLVILTAEGHQQTLEADSIIPSIPLMPDDSLFESLKGQIPEVYAIGDCKKPEWIVDAIAEGSKIARKI
jgi:2,4-dienoyl-CoA reductase (NADPH2)